MKDETTFIRWGIPGWTVAIAILIFVFSDYFSANDDRMFVLLNQAFLSTGSWQALLAALLVSGAGIPLGFVIYQIYFYLRWNSPVSKDGFFPPLIVGRLAELKDFMRDLSADDLSLGIDWRKDLISGADDHRSVWYYVTSLLAEAFLSADPGGGASDRHKYLLDTLHTLGASHLAFYFGFGTYLLIKWRLGHVELWWSVIALMVVFVTKIFLSTEDRRNKNALKILNMTVKYPAEVFIASLFFLYLTLNPAVNVLLPPGFPIILCLTVFWLWGWSVRDSREIIWGLAIVLLIITSAVKLSPIAKGLHSLNWPVILSVLIFTSISLAFLKNRQNTRETLVTMEYHYVRRYLASEENRTAADPVH